MGSCTRLKIASATLQAAAERHLSGLAEWERPRAGMFLWVRLLAGVLDSSSVMQACKDARVIVVPGMCCICCQTLEFVKAGISNCRAGYVLHLPSSTSTCETWKSGSLGCLGQGI